MKLILILFCLLISTISYAEGLYRWTDKDGKVHYGDRPAEDAVKSEKKRFNDSAETSDDDLPYSLRKLKSDFPVTLYSSPNCGEYCNEARALLVKRGIPFTEKNILSKEDAEALKAKTGAATVPVLTIGKSILNGYEITRWNMELDVAGYPKSAPFGVHIKSPAPAPLVEPAPKTNTETESPMPTEVNQ